MEVEQLDDLGPCRLVEQGELGLERRRQPSPETCGCRVLARGAVWPVPVVVIDVVDDETLELAAVPDRCAVDGSRLSVPTQRSAKAFAPGVRIGVLRTFRCSGRKASPKASTNWLPGRARARPRHDEPSSPDGLDAAARSAIAGWPGGGGDYFRQQHSSRSTHSDGVGYGLHSPLRHRFNAFGAPFWLFPYVVFSHTEMCDGLVEVNGSRVQVAQRSLSVMPACRAMRSSSEGHTYL